MPGYNRILSLAAEECARNRVVVTDEEHASGNTERQHLARSLTFAVISGLWGGAHTKQLQIAQLANSSIPPGWPSSGASMTHQRSWLENAGVQCRTSILTIPPGSSL
jgi:hypothetical protein